MAGVLLHFGPKCVRRSILIIGILATSSLSAQSSSATSTLRLDPPSVSIPDADPNGRWTLTDLTRVSVLKDGGYAVIQPQAIVRFTNKGTLVRSYGRSGRGPGEFSQISGMAECSDSRIAVTDWILRRASFFDATTGKAEVAPFSTDATSGLMILGCDEQHILFVDHTDNRKRAAAWPRHAIRQDTLLVVRATQKLVAIDTAARVAGGSTFDGLLQPFGGSGVAIATAGGFAVARTDDSVTQLIARQSLPPQRIAARGLPVVPIRLVAVRDDDAIVIHRRADDTESLQVRRITGW